MIERSTADGWSTNASAAPRGEHTLQLYDSDTSFHHLVARYVAEGLRAGAACIVIVTPAHRDGVASCLAAEGIDVAGAFLSGAYLPLDARETVDTFMRHGMVDPALVHARLGPILERAGDGGRPVRAVGEMVVLLWSEGNRAAAMDLEEAWNALQATYTFSLLCPYPLHGFGHDRSAIDFLDVCERHAQVVPSESYSLLTEPDERFRAIASLEQKVSVLEAENTRLQEQAQEAIRMRDEFLIAAAHDLRTPMTVIRAHAQSLQRRLADQPPLPGTVTDALGTIERRTRMMATVLDDLTDASYLQSPVITLERQTVDLGALVREMVACYAHLTSRHTITVESEEGMIGEWDDVRLTRVLGNVLNNAIKYSPAGGTIVVRVARGGDTGVVLSVADRGMGIPAGDLPHIFERFYRARNVRDRTSGTGIGLSTAKQIVEQHGGTIAVDSEEGVGTTFVVRLPALPTAA